jgi:hypothetical protein
MEIVCETNATSYSPPELEKLPSCFATRSLHVNEMRWKRVSKTTPFPRTASPMEIIVV